MVPINVIDEITSQVLAGMPNEVCGYLAGVGREVKQALPVPNIADRPEISFLMDPKAQLNTLLVVEEYGWEIVGIYHSHPPGSRTDPSPRDVAGMGDTNCLHVIAVPGVDTTSMSVRVFEVRDGVVAEVPLGIESEP